MRRLIVGGLLGTLLVAVPAHPAAAETTVRVSGNRIIVTIPVDVIGATDRYATAPNGQPLLDYWETVLNDSWGAAFGTIPYKSCYFLELKLKLTARPADFDATDGRHRVLVSAPTGGLTFEGTGFEGAEETSRDHVTRDGTRSMENDRDGAIPVDAPPRVIAHEFGHLFGLGQDDVEEGRPVDTVMVGGEAPGVDLTIPGRIDRNLITRIGKIVERYLKDQGRDPLAPCQKWRGSIEGSGDNVGICENVTVHNGTFTIGVAADGAAILSGHMVNSAGTGCGAAGRPEMTEVSFVLAGERSRDEFDFPPIATFPFPMQLDIAGGHATGSSTENPGGDGVYVVTLDFEADCAENCEEAAVG